MFRHGSWIRRTGVAIALLIGLCAGTLTLPHADGRDDLACNPVPIAHDESAHYIGTGSTAAQADADHCFLCHSLRSFHSGLDTFEHRDDAPHAEHLTPALADRSGLVEWTLVPGRAPPS